MFKDPKDDPRDAYYTRWVEVRASPIHGHGVFATRDIAKDRIIEVSPAIVYSEALHKEGRELASYLGSAPHAVHVLEAYAFSWDKCGMVAMAWDGPVYTITHLSLTSRSIVNMRTSVQAPNFKPWWSRPSGM